MDKVSKLVREVGHVRGYPYPVVWEINTSFFFLRKEKVFTLSFLIPPHSATFSGLARHHCLASNCRPPLKNPAYATDYEGSRRCKKRLIIIIIITLKKKKRKEKRNDEHDRREGEKKEKGKEVHEEKKKNSDYLLFGTVGCWV